ncbi:MAG: 3-phosphoserine/phosphohydroxythreonine transaminase [Muribaculaceae bacterium]|nr:3-phosphoserine/phosphohydroxythreonine transaminase [Muribaculaceae bacterium]MBQ4138918.1 3-phosphoserine/phosphohydroxythreonine transaminase [Muribaculaceae bacterium]
MKKHNFYAGPSILSQYTIDKTIEAIRDFDNTGLSILEISHRSKQFQAVMDKAQALFKELLDIPEGYEVLFLGGGASTQFAMVPYNLLKTKAAYLDTGTWAHKAIKEAKLFGEVNVVASSEQDNYVYYPTEFEVPTDVDYLHITTNNTVYGTELRRDLDVPVRMVADMSSDIFSRPVDVSKYDLIYGGAQKNLAPAGVTFVIVKVDALGKVDRAIPTMLNYETHVKKGSMFNTPPVLPIYSALKTLEWYKELGGVKRLQEIDEEKARVLYDAIDSSRMFVGTVNPDSRSIMNVCFVMKPEYKELEQEFIDFAGTKGIMGIKGHRSVGGFRASLYNALPLDSVKVLTAAMKEFENNH